LTLISRAPEPSTRMVRMWFADLYISVFESPQDGRSAGSLLTTRAGAAGEPSGFTGITCSSESMMKATFVPSGESTAAPSSRSEIWRGAGATA
jgi:hypothetical protein